MSIRNKVQNQNRISSGQTLPGYIAGDVSAACVSAALISPILTVIDRAVVENLASRSPLLPTFKKTLLNAIRQPCRFFIARPFLCMCTLYSVTYTTANTIGSLTEVFIGNESALLAKSTTFFATCVVNVPLGVWKDIRFVQIFGCQAPLSSFVKRNTSQIKTPTSPIFPRSAAATFLFRDAITILGSFTLPTMLSHSIPLPDPTVQMAAAQIMVPVISQIVATPVHLLGLDLYANPRSEARGERASRIRASLLGTTVIRCGRIIPAFGIGGVVNTGLRDWFHRRVNVRSSRPTADRDPGLISSHNVGFDPDT